MREKQIMMGIVKKQVILIGAGEWNTNMADTIKEKQAEDSFIIALDGGLVFCEEQGIVPDMIVGDFDSLPLEKQELLEKYPQEIIYRLPCEKDDTDTLAALRFAVERGFEHFVIYGGLGGRFSHTMANIQSLLFLKEQGLHGELIGSDSRIFLIKDGSCTFSAKEKGYVSVFALGGTVNGVTLRNLKYEISDAELTDSFPIGVSNEFVGKEAEIKVGKGVLLVVTERKE